MRQALESETLHHIYARVSHRYDRLHGLITAKSDQRGRRMLVQHCAKPGDFVLDCGGGTGSTTLLAAQIVGSEGRIVLFDLSEAMLQVAQRRLRAAGLVGRVSFCVGDMHHLPFSEDTFDVVLSTYSVCPLQDPAQGALEMYRVLRPGGLLGIAHSAEPKNRILRGVAAGVESLAWKFPSLSMGCRPVQVLQALQNAGAQLRFHRRIGVPLWPFEVFVVEKPQV